MSQNNTNKTTRRPETRLQRQDRLAMEAWYSTGAQILNDIDDPAHDRKDNG